MNMSNIRRGLQEMWERGVERASEESPHAQELDESKLNEVAGLRIRSGLQGGNLTPSLESGPACPQTIYCTHGC